MLLKIVLVLLVVFILLLSFLLYKVNIAFRNLSEKRLEIYVAHLGDLHKVWHRLHRERTMERVDPILLGQFDLISSIPTMRLSSETIGYFADFLEKRKNSAPIGEMAAAEQKVEKLLIELCVSMRDDLALNTGEARMPNAEVFRSNRGRT